MKTVSTTLFLMFLVTTLTMFAQSQETIDAIQDQRLSQVERSSVVNSSAIYDLTAQMTAMRSSLDRFTGMGMGIGAVLAALQLVQVIIQVRNGKKT